MSNAAIYAIVLLAVAAIIVVIYVICRAKKLEIFSKLIQLKPVLGAISAQVESVADLLPTQYMDTILLVLSAATEGAETAEHLWKLGQLPKDERNAYAKQVAQQVLEKAGIEITDQIRMIVDGIIEIVCILLPHDVKPEEAKEQGE